MISERPGLRVPGVWDGYELTVRAVLGQQLTVVDAPALAGRLVRMFGRPIQISIHGLSHLFPQPGILAEADLTNIRIPADQAATISSLAHAVLAGKLDFNSGQGLQGILSRLCIRSGSAQDVASYIAMRSFGEPDALPHTDRGLRRACATQAKPVSPAELLRSSKGSNRGGPMPQCTSRRPCKRLPSPLRDYTNIPTETSEFSTRNGKLSCSSNPSLIIRRCEGVRWTSLAGPTFSRLH
jgi:3-methyladenine DNA glycosylase/8-oxoguanine DNA glycosylase